MQWTSKPPYLVACVIAVSSLAIQEWAAAEPWYDTIPFAMIFVLSLSFLAGLIIQDFLNKRSWIWQNIRSLTKIFEGDGFLTKVYENGRSLSYKLKASRNFQRCEITVTYTALEQTTTFPRGRINLRWDGVHSGESIYLPFVSIARAPGQDYGPLEQVYWGIDENVQWGNEAHRDRRNQPGAITKIVITARYGMFRQTQELYAICRNHDAVRSLITVWQGDNEIIYVDR